MTARPGDSAAEARRRALADPLQYLLVVDEQNRPIGWVAAEDLPREGQVTEAMANPVSPTVSRRTLVTIPSSVFQRARSP